MHNKQVRFWHNGKCFCKDSVVVGFFLKIEAKAQLEKE
jgi:hypothetical protein